MTLPATSEIGAASAMVVAITTRICACSTSLVMRVINDGAPKAPTSRAEKSVTRWKRFRAQVAAEAHGDAGPEPNGGDREDHLHERDARA